MRNSERLSNVLKNDVKGGKGLTKESVKQENELLESVEEVKSKLTTLFPELVFKFEKQLLLKDIVEKLRKIYPNEIWNFYFDKTNIKPDGGFLYIEDKNENKYPILISEAKKQGTNDKRIEEGKGIQAQGNAIERLGKNVIGLRTWMTNESIFPFVCFGYGEDFDKNSTILDRVVTIAEFGELCKIYLHNTLKTNRGSYFFKKQKWNKEEMVKILLDISTKSIYYYFSKYDENNFKK